MSLTLKDFTPPYAIAEGTTDYGADMFTVEDSLSDVVLITYERHVAETIVAALNDDGA